METTVTMSLNEFKDMETKARIMELLNEHQNYVIHRSSYGDYFVSVNDEAHISLLHDMQYAIKMRDDLIKKIEAYEKSIGKKVITIW